MSWSHGFINSWIFSKSAHHGPCSETSPPHRSWTQRSLRDTSASGGQQMGEISGGLAGYKWSSIINTLDPSCAGRCLYNHVLSRFESSRLLCQIEHMQKGIVPVV